MRYADAPADDEADDNPDGNPVAGRTVRVPQPRGAEPAGPVDSVTPAGPVDSVTPVEPVDSVAPVEPVEPVDSVTPVEPVEQLAGGPKPDEAAAGGDQRSRAGDRQTGTGQAPSGSALTERERKILAFERRWWKHAGAKEQAIRDTFDISATRYYQILNGLLDNPDALAIEPVLVARLRRLRATRSRNRRR